MGYLSYDRFREVMYSLDSHLGEFVSVEDAMMSCSVKEAFDFSASYSRLVEIGTAVAEVRALLSEFADQEDGNYSINAAISYVDLLLASIRQLTAIAHNLARKAGGTKYGFLAYRGQLRDYRKKEAIRAAAGDTLNSVFSRPW